MLEVGSGSDTVKDMYLQCCFWKRAYPQKHTSASWCCFTIQSGCHRWNLSVSNNSRGTDTVRNSLSNFTFTDVFRLCVKAKGLKTLILEYAESLPDCLHPVSGAFGYCRRKRASSLFLFETCLVNWIVCHFCVLTNIIFLHKSNTTYMETPRASHAAMCVPTVEQWWVTLCQKAVLHSH